MANTRQASKPVKKAESDDKKPMRTGIRILVRDLRVGDRIVVAWHDPKKDPKAKLTVDEVLDVLGGQSNETSTRLVAKTKEVKDKEECPGQWRTHVHINRNECYDTRQHVWIEKV